MGEIGRELTRIDERQTDHGGTETRRKAGKSYR
jgi:hypothetical protein